MSVAEDMVEEVGVLAVGKDAVKESLFQPFSVHRVLCLMALDVDATFPHLTDCISTNNISSFN